MGAEWSQVLNSGNDTSIEEGGTATIKGTFGCCAVRTRETHSKLRSRLPDWSGVSIRVASLLISLLLFCSVCVFLFVSVCVISCGQIILVLIYHQFQKDLYTSVPSVEQPISPRRQHPTSLLPATSLHVTSPAAAPPPTPPKKEPKTQFV